MKPSIPTAALSALLTLSGVAHAQNAGQQEFVPERDAEFTFKVESRGIERQIPVDCDRLDENGELTSKFLHTMGVWGHLDRINESFLPEAQKIQHMYGHLVLHSAEFRQDIPRAVEKCHNDYPEKSFGPDAFD